MIFCLWFLLLTVICRPAVRLQPVEDSVPRYIRPRGQAGHAVEHQHRLERRRHAYACVCACVCVYACLCAFLRVVWDLWSCVVDPNGKQTVLYTWQNAVQGNVSISVEMGDEVTSTWCVLHLRFARWCYLARWCVCLVIAQLHVSVSLLSVCVHAGV